MTQANHEGSGLAMTMYTDLKQQFDDYKKMTDTRIATLETSMLTQQQTISLLIESFKIIRKADDENT